jgi:two-component system chemotaxis sensor kinase CheA
MLRDLASKLGKKSNQDPWRIDYGQGSTEKITDPLTHLIRTAPTTASKPGGTPRQTEAPSINLHVQPPGGRPPPSATTAKASREKPLKKAREKGMDAPDT